MFLAPSAIHYITSEQNNMSPLSADSVDILAASRQIALNGDFRIPKVQVVHKDGHWFTLNNAQLDLCRRLEQEGDCTKVKVDIVPLTEIPVMVRKLMRLPVCQPQDSAGEDMTAKESPGTPVSSENKKTSSKGYHKLGQQEPKEEEEEEEEGKKEGKKDKPTESEADDSDTSGMMDSDSECDWSAGEAGTSEVESSAEGSDGSDSDDERNCLL